MRNLFGAVLLIAGLLTAAGSCALAEDAGAATPPPFAIVPATKTVTIDGDVAEWNTSGKLGPITFDDEMMDDYHGTFYAMYDQENLYLAAVIVEPHAPYNAFPKKGVGAWNGDDVIIRLSTRPTTQWPLQLADTEKTPDLWNGDFWYNHLTKTTLWDGYRGMRSTPLLQQKEMVGVTAVAVPAQDGKGYTMEIKMPWAFLNAEAPRPKPGDHIALLWEISLGANAAEPSRLFQIVANGGGDTYRSHTGWGKAVFK